MHSEEKVKKYLCDYISSHYKVRNGIEFDTELVRSGTIDSFGIIQLLNAIEEDFKIQLPAELLTPENFESVNAITKCLLSIKES